MSKFGQLSSIQMKISPYYNQHLYPKNKVGHNIQDMITTTHKLNHQLPWVARWK